MRFLSKKPRWTSATAMGRFALMLTFASLTNHCGIASYPGQNGIVTNGYSKIDLELLMDDGLWVYEVSYDNRPGGAGVGAVVSKLYPNVRTYTSNVRTNADGTLYRAKAAYKGAVVQMIALPGQNQVVLGPESHVQLFVEYKQPLDEVDDQNIAESGLFSPSNLSQDRAPLNDLGLALQKAKFSLLKAGRLNYKGDISYEITSIELGSKVFTPEKSIVVETNFIQSGVRTNLSSATKDAMLKFLNFNFPSGFEGVIKINVNGTRIPLEWPLKLSTKESFPRQSPHSPSITPSIKFVDSESDLEILAQKYVGLTLDKQ